jgi:hypothetical protein
MEGLSVRTPATVTMVYVRSQVVCRNVCVKQVSRRMEIIFVQILMNVLLILAIAERKRNV